MKKILRVLGITMIMVSIFTLGGCASFNAKPVSEETFTKTMEAKGLTVQDITKDGLGVESTEGKVDKALIASGEGYQFIYAAFNEKAAAVEYFEQMKELNQEEHPNGNTINGNINDNREFSCTDGDSYFRSVQKDALVVTAVVVEGNGAEDVKALFKEIGY